MHVNVIGAGLAGCEAAFQIARRGIKVKLFEMKPAKKTPAHKSDLLCELVCSNSFKANRTDSAAGTLKQEMRMLSSLIMECADKSRVEAGGALAVDRMQFSSLVTEKIRNNRNIEVIPLEVTEIPDGITVIATGPLTSEVLSQKIIELTGGALSFFDAAAPIIAFDSIDMDNAFIASRYESEGGDYINCPMNKEQYEAFYTELLKAERAPLKDFDVNNPKVYEGCMPVEVLASRGADTLRFGPMKPVGLRDPKTGHRPWAVLQLRKETAEGDIYNLVGFQTNLKFGEQKRVFSFIPALKNAEYVRYGVMHRNTFIDSPRLLHGDYSVRVRKELYFAGQITGVEGYIESCSSGMLAGINAAMACFGMPQVIFPKTTVIGALAGYISDESVLKFQPMGANLGILPPLQNKVRDKKIKAQLLSERALADLNGIIIERGL